MSRPRPARLLLALTAAMACTVPACGSADPPPPPPPCPTAPPAPGLAIAVGARANTAVPAWPAELVADLDAVTEAADGDTRQGVTMVRVDGRPSIGCVVTYDNGGASGPSQEANRTAFTNAVRQRVGQMTAQVPEADPLEALGLAADAAGPDGTVVLMDSGLSTVPPLDFRRPGLFSADPDRVVAALDDAGALPDLTGRSVVLVGIGYTAEPQASLNSGQRTRLIELWHRIATAAGATSVRPITAASTTAPAAGLPLVSTVAVPEPDAIDLGCGTEAVLPDDGPVGFRPGSTDFVDAVAARERLAGFADWLVQNNTARAHVTGSIAHYDDNSTGGLSRDRAERVREILIEAGATAGQVTAVGAGWGPFPGPSAPPDDVSDQLNRRVIIELGC